MSESKYPDKIFIKGGDLVDGHCRTKGNTFSAPMYVIVNPLFCEHEMDAEYHHVSVVDNLQDKIDKLEAQIEKMKCCDNCEHFNEYQYDCGNPDCLECVRNRDFRNWEPKTKAVIGE